VGTIGILPGARFPSSGRAHGCAGEGEVEWLGILPDRRRRVTGADRGTAETFAGHPVDQTRANRARNVLAGAGLEAQIESRRLRGAGPGAGLFLFAEYVDPPSGETVTAGFTAYGRKGLPAEHVAETACEELLDHFHSGAPVDPYLADQLVLPAALAKGESRVTTSRVSQHLLTSVGIVREFISRGLRVEGEPGEPGTLIVQSTGGEGGV
jgi:RNA 3'-terminal phosphate cyclase (ATP)